MGGADCVSGGGPVLLRSSSARTQAVPTDYCLRRLLSVGQCVHLRHSELLVPERRGSGQRSAGSVTAAAWRR
jgi:hypothetical protein